MLDEKFINTWHRDKFILKILLPLFCNFNEIMWLFKLMANIGEELCSAVDHDRLIMMISKC